MVKTFLISFRLKYAYMVNSILHGFKQIPIVKKLFPDEVYSMAGFKVFAYVLAIIWGITSTVAYKFGYLFCAVYLWVDMLREETPDTLGLFYHLLVPMTIIGAFLNNYMFTPEKHKYYAMMQLGMDAKKYTLTNFLFSLIRHFIGFSLMAVLVCFMLHMELWHGLVAAVFLVCAKTAVCPLEMLLFKKGRRPKFGFPALLIAGLLVLTVYMTAFFGSVMPLGISYGIIAAAALCAVAAIPYILRFDAYRALNRDILTEEFMNQMDRKAVQKAALQKVTSEAISTDTGLTSEKRGFEYLNELFIKRHRKLLWGSSLKITAFIAFSAVAVGILCLYAPSAAFDINDTVYKSLPYFTFIMFAINRGMGFTQALFVNCDRSLLTYSFYKEPASILALFRIRLREIIKVNLLPAAVLGAGLSGILYVSGGTDDAVTYGIIFVSVCALSVFFSVHYLTIYYLLQPYNEGTEVKNGTYKLITWLTYMACFIFLYQEIPAPIFGSLTILFCIAYILTARFLVYRFAPKTFKIHS